jgi:hypothetical protein
MKRALAISKIACRIIGHKKGPVVDTTVWSLAMDDRLAHLGLRPFWPMRYWICSRCGKYLSEAEC